MNSKLNPYKFIIFYKYLKEKISAESLAKEFNVSKPSIIKFLKSNGIKTRSSTEARQIRAKKELLLYKQKITQICTQCNEEKQLNSTNFGFRNRSTGKFHKECKICMSKRCKEYKKKNKEKLKIKRNEKKNETALRNKEYYKANRKRILDYKKQYKKENKERINAYKRNYNKNKYYSDPTYRLRTILGKIIRTGLIKRDSSKYGESYLNKIGYSIQELKEHLESQFEPWMNWNNYGAYKKHVWKDDDQSTWTWQIDHIIPHSHFNYKSMNDSKFRICWGLKNLRPLSSKQNCLDGARKFNI